MIDRDNIITTKADDEVRNQIQNSGNNEVVTETEETTTTPPTVVTPSVGTTTEPYFNKQQQVALTLMPLASALLQGKTQGGQSQLSGLLAAAGQGLAGSTNVALQLAQLEDARKKTSTTASKQYVLQEGFEGKVDVGGTQYSKEDNIVFNFTPDQVNAYPQGTFMEYTKPKTDKATSKEMFVVKDFEIDGVKYEKGTREIPQAVINKQLSIQPNVFGKDPTEDADSSVDVFTTQDATIGGVFFKAGTNRMTNEQIVEAQKIPGLFGKAPKEFAPTSFDKQKKRVTDILDKVQIYAKENKIDIRNDIDQNIFDQLSDKDIFDLQLYIADIARPQIEKYVDERGNTITRERKRADVLDAYKNAFGDARYKQLINRIILGKAGDDAFEDRLAKLESGSEVDYDKIASGLVSKTDDIAKQAKPLGKAEAETASKAISALNALNSASEVLFDQNGNIRRRMLITPAQFITQKGKEKQKYVRAIEQAVEILIRVRSGAAVPEQEFQRYKKMYTPSIIDSSEVAKLKMNAIVNEFGVMLNLLQEGREQDLLKGFEQDKDGNITKFKFLNPDLQNVDFDDNAYFKNQAGKQDGSFRQ